MGKGKQFSYGSASTSVSVKICSRPGHVITGLCSLGKLTLKVDQKETKFHELKLCEFTNPFITTPLTTFDAPS